MFRSLRYRNFRLFFFGQVFSLTGSWIQQTAQAWLVYRLTKDPMMLGLVAFVAQFPVFALGFHAGILVDRWDRLRLVRWTQALAMVLAAVLAVLAMGGWVRVWHVLATSLLLGCVTALDLPARQVLIGELVEPADRHNALALNSTIVNITRIVGPALAGLLIGEIGEGGCFALNAVSYLSILAALSLMRGVRQSPAQTPGSAWEEIGNGLAYALGHEPIRAILLVLGLVSLAGLPLFVLLPIFAEDVLRSGARGLGVLSSCAGLGATVGALALARRRSSTGFGETIARGALLLGGALVGLAFSKAFWLSCVLMWLVGLAAISVLAGSNAVLQELSSDRFRGRVMSFYSMLFIGVSPVGSFLVGGLASRVGVTLTVCLQAAVCAAAGLAYWKRLPRLLAGHATRPPGALGDLGPTPG